MIITWFLSVAIFINSIISLLRADHFLRFILHPVSIIKDRQYYRIFTSDFVHNDLTHLLLNEVMLIFVCGKLERYLVSVTSYGELFYLAIYLISMLSCNVVVTLLNRSNSDYSCAGASGSILGCMFSLILLQPHLTAYYLPMIGKVTNLYGALIFIVGLIIYRLRTGNKMINHEGHFFGAFGGILATLILFLHDFI